MSPEQVCVVLPTFNEKENLEDIARAIRATGYRLLVVDDDSPDGTGAIADSLAEFDRGVSVLHRPVKEGLGPAYAAGFDRAMGEGASILIEMDADFSHQPGFLAPMIRHMHDFDVVIGSRYVQGGQTQNWGLRRRLISRGGGLYARSVLGVQIQDLTSGFIAWRRDVLEALDLSAVQASGYGFQIEMKYRAARAGFRILETPITFPDRTHGESKMSANIFSEALSLVWKLRLGR